MVSQLVYFYSGTAILMFFDKFQKNIKILLPCALLIYLFKSEFIVFEYLAPFAFAIIIIGIAYNFRYLNFIGKYSNVAYGIYLFHFPVIQTILHYKIHEYSFFVGTCALCIFDNSTCHLLLELYRKTIYAFLSTKTASRPTLKSKSRML